MGRSMSNAMSRSPTSRPPRAVNAFGHLDVKIGNVVLSTTAPKPGEVAVVCYRNRPTAYQRRFLWRVARCCERRLIEQESPEEHRSLGERMTVGFALIAAVPVAPTASADPYSSCKEATADGAAPLLKGILATARNSILTATGWPALRARAPITSRRKTSRRASPTNTPTHCVCSTTAWMRQDEDNEQDGQRAPR